MSPVGPNKRKLPPSRPRRVRSDLNSKRVARQRMQLRGHRGRARSRRRTTNVIFRQPLPISERELDVIRHVLADDLEAIFHTERKPRND